VFLIRSIGLGVAALVFAVPLALAGPPPHAGGVRVAPAPVGGVRIGPAPIGVVRPPVAVPYYSGYRNGVSIGIGVGSGLYGPLGYGLGYSPFGAYGWPYGGVGYGALGYAYGLPATRSIVVVGVPVVSGVSIPNPYVPPQPSVGPGDPIPLPLPAPGTSGQAEPATITVITSPGATVSFDGLESEQPGARHSFTTRPITAGVTARVSVKVTGPSGGVSTVSISVKAGEKATVDMRN
jgi:uncharacterized protein (TIGR03000 family)